MSHEVSRRDFFKVGGLGAVAAGAAGLGIGSILGIPQEAVAETVAVTDFVYTCPICGQKTSDYGALVSHFEKEHPKAAVPECATLNINGAEVKVQVEPHWTLRETMVKAVGLSGGGREMCDRGGCGSCTVLIDGKPALACTTLVVECQGKAIETSEGIAADPAWRPLWEAYARNDTAQCGYCTPAMFTMAKYIIEKYGEPTEEQIRMELSGNICRCGTYCRHVKAITEAAAEIKGGN